MTQIEMKMEDGTVKKFLRVEDVCTHKEEHEREFVAVLGHDELAHALERGYVVKKLYHALVWPEQREDGTKIWRDDLFKQYIRDFAKLKVECGGWSKVSSIYSSLTNVYF